MKLSVLAIMLAGAIVYFFADGVYQAAGALLFFLAVFTAGVDLYNASRRPKEDN